MAHRNSVFLQLHKLVPIRVAEYYFAGLCAVDMF